MDFFLSDQIFFTPGENGKIMEIQFINCAQMLLKTFRVGGFAGNQKQTAFFLA